MNIFRSVLMGAPASGKGTISSRIVKYFDVNHVSSGDLLRCHIRENTEIGKHVKECIARGGLVPDDIMTKLINAEIKKIGNANWLLDGFPRTKCQAESLLSSYAITGVINLVVPFDVIIKRVEGRWIHPASGRVYNTDYSRPKIEGIDDITGEPLVQRPDDKPEVVRQRLEIYAATSEPLLELYRKAGILQNVEGKTSDEIWPHVYKYICGFIKPKIELQH